MRRNKLDLIFYSKIINNEVEICEENKPKQTHNLNTRNSQKRACYQQAKLNIRRNSFFVRVPKIYLKLPLQLANANTSHTLHCYLNSGKFEIPSFRST